MKWTIKSQHLDKRTGKHIVVFHEPESGSVHHLVVLQGPNHDSCITCGHVHHRNAEGLDIKARVEQELLALQASHDSMEAYANKHGIQILKADGTFRKAR